MAVTTKGRVEKQVSKSNDIADEFKKTFAIVESFELDKRSMELIKKGRKGIENELKSLIEPIDKELEKLNSDRSNYENMIKNMGTTDHERVVADMYKSRIAEDEAQIKKLEAQKSEINATNPAVKDLADYAKLEEKYGTEKMLKGLEQVMPLLDVIKHSGSKIDELAYKLLNNEPGTAADAYGIGKLAESLDKAIGSGKSYDTAKETMREVAVKMKEFRKASAPIIEALPAIVEISEKRKLVFHGLDTRTDKLVEAMNAVGKLKEGDMVNALAQFVALYKLGTTAKDITSVYEKTINSSTPHRWLSVKAAFDQDKATFKKAYTELYESSSAKAATAAASASVQAEAKPAQAEATAVSSATTVMARASWTAEIKEFINATGNSAIVSAAKLSPVELKKIEDNEQLTLSEALSIYGRLAREWSRFHERSKKLPGERYFNEIIEGSDLQKRLAAASAMQRLQQHAYLSSNERVLRHALNADQWKFVHDIKMHKLNFEPERRKQFEGNDDMWASIDASVLKFLATSKILRRQTSTQPAPAPSNETEKEVEIAKKHAAKPKKKTPHAGPSQQQTGDASMKPPESPEPEKEKGSEGKK